VLGAVVGFVWAQRASADEPVRATEPKVLHEPGEVTQVVDAFDGEDPFDLHITLGYQHTWNSANIRRETSIDQPGLTSGGYKADTMNVASYSESTSRLNTRIDAGVYKDVGLYLRLPIILSNSRDLKGLSGSENIQGVALAGAPGEQLFSLPFSSPNRSGIEYLAIGLDANVFNQTRDNTKPTWLVGLEGRFNVSEPMHACNSKPAAGQVQCADPSDVNRNGRGGDVDPITGLMLEGTSASARKPGVSRGTTGLEFHTLLSRRIKYIEPYGGFRALFEFPTSSSDFGQTNLQGSLVNHPPLEGWVIMGMQVIPWENREAFQRVTFDGRVQGSYRSEGRDYSAMFDALGSTAAPSMRRPNYSDYRYSGDPQFQGTSVVDPASQKVYFSGITDVQAHGRFGAFGSVTWQAGEYIKFQFGMGYTYIQSHFITMDQPCNPDFKSDAGKAGPCHTSSATNTAFGSATGIPNPNYRPQINHVGSRFKVDDNSMVDLWVNGVVMF
jgi:hypothetical protein